MLLSNNSTIGSLQLHCTSTQIPVFPFATIATGKNYNIGSPTKSNLKEATIAHNGQQTILKTV
jgi:hypothetical protein